jgi:hypothetical protein
MRNYIVIVKKCAGTEQYTVVADSPEEVVEQYLKHIHVQANILKVNHFGLADIVVRLADGKRCPNNFYKIQFVSYTISEKEIEEQKKWTNRNTLVPMNYINSGEYRRKFDIIADGNIQLARTLYHYAKEMLIHRSGTEFEDMLWYDMRTFSEVDYAKTEKVTKEIQYPQYRIEKLKSYQNGTLLTMHTHPNSAVPSTADFNGFVERNYFASYVICHNGQIFQYSATQFIDENDARLYNVYINKWLREGLSIGQALENACNNIGYIAAKEVV